MVALVAASGSLVVRSPESGVRRRISATAPWLPTPAPFLSTWVAQEAPISPKIIANTHTPLFQRKGFILPPPYALRSVCFAIAVEQAPLRLLWRLSAHLGQHPRDERQQLLQRLKLRGLPRHHMLDTPHKAPLFHVRLRPELHDKRPVDR